MTVTASAPGKVVLLGEYLVLDGAPALVMAVERRCHAAMTPDTGGPCRLTTRMPEFAVTEFSAGAPSGAPLVDAVIGFFGWRPPWPGFSVTIDSADFYAHGLKLGLGSSAAALVAFAGAIHAAAGNAVPALHELIQCHRAFQGDRGSGIDVAAACQGGVARFSLEHSEPRVSSVRLPKSVGFAGIFAGGSASTPNLVGRYRRWAGSKSARQASLQRRMSEVAERGCAAVSEEDGSEFVAAIEDYGHCLAELGAAMGVDLVTVEHRRIGELAGSMGLAYKVSGAGGGDIGIACGLDSEAIRAFEREAAAQGFFVVPLAVDDQGLKVEEHAE